MPCVGIEADQNEPGKVPVDPEAIATAIPVDLGNACGPIPVLSRSAAKPEISALPCVRRSEINGRLRMRKFRSFVCIGGRAHERPFPVHTTFAGTRMLEISKSLNQGCCV